MPPMTESSVACSWISVTASRMFSTEFSGNARSDLLDQVARLVLLAREREQREREEEERDEREDGEVGDHRREMRAPVGEELADDRVHGEGVYGRVLGLPPVEAAQALADLVEISSQIESAVLADADGTVLGSTLGRRASAAEAIAREARRAPRGAADRGNPTQVEVDRSPRAASSSSRDDERLVAAVTGRDPTAGLVFYDLKTCLRLAGEEPRQTKKAAAPRRRRKKKEPTEPEPAQAKAAEEASDGEG